MPRSMQEIIDQADELARKFENYEPRPEDERPGETLARLHEAALNRSEAEKHLADAVRYARKDGLPWAAIGAALGTSGEAARQRYGSLSPVQ